MAAKHQGGRRGLPLCSVQALALRLTLEKPSVWLVPGEGGIQAARGGANGTFAGVQAGAKGGILMAI